MSHAAAKYPGSWARVIISVKVNERTSEKPCSTSNDGIQMNAP